MNCIEWFTALFEIIVKLLSFPCSALTWGLASILVVANQGQGLRLFFLAPAWKGRNGVLWVLLGKFWASWNLPCGALQDAHEGTILMYYFAYKTTA